jgi:hypothetical protein
MSFERPGIESPGRLVAGQAPAGHGRQRWFTRLSFASRGLLIAAGLVILICLFFAEENVRGRRAWEACRRELEAKGVEMDWVKFVPAPVPDGENFAMTPFLAPLCDFNPRPRQGGDVWRDKEGHERALNFAASLMPENEPASSSLAPFTGNTTDLSKAYSLLRGRTNQESGEQNFATRSEAATAVLSAMEELSPVLRELRQASQRPQSRFNLEYDSEDVMSILLPHYIVLQHVSRALRVRASAELALNNTDAAFEDVKLMLFLVNATRNEPFLVTLQLRGNLLKLSEQIIWEGLSGHRWTESQLKEIQTRLGEFTLLADLERGLKAERAAGGGTLLTHLRRHKNLLRIWVAAPNPAGTMSYLLGGPEGWFYQEQVSFHRLYETRILPGLDVKAGRFYPSTIEANRKGLERDTRHYILDHTAVAKVMCEMLPDMYRKNAVGQTRLQMAIAACALERFRLAEGKYPETLSELVPRFVTNELRDPCTGESLKYHRSENGRLALYGVGWNEKDDGGVAVMNRDGTDVDPNQGDWVWPPYVEVN